ncbi:uncharacterized protein YALI1_E25126g [Yarrowia lipolytica]|uniref:Secreted protein n=1 Tax=Yarrowia lipolytica TaxID=4952 RepID=A0A1D8NJD5_YARLL|nr:hypothetical protein YALI1_E25126g [Yarrowia lipolytica]
MRGTNKNQRDVLVLVVCVLCRLCFRRQNSGMSVTCSSLLTSSVRRVRCRVCKVVGEGRRGFKVCLCDGRGVVMAQVELSSNVSQRRDKDWVL